MSRHGYHYDLDNWTMIKYRGRVASAIRGHRGQAFLRDLIAALDAMPKKELVGGSLVTADGAVCAMGAVCKRRGIELEVFDPDDEDSRNEWLADNLDIADVLVCETAFENDEGGRYMGESPSERWTRMRKWAERNLKK